MKYRTNKRTGDQISEIGMGTAYIVEAEKQEAVRTVRHAFESGINYYDLAAGDGTAFNIFGEALHDVRDQVMYQIHFGADYSKVTYGWSLDLDTIKQSVDRQLKDLKTDYINYGFIHCQDESADWKSYQENGILEYLLSSVYCNHCEPCPAGLDIGMINKFYDLAKIGDDMAREHYLALGKKASNCLSCGHCNSRCPFAVDQMSRIQEISAYFGI